MAIAPILGPSHSIIIGELLKYKRFLTHYRLLTNVFFFSFTYIIHICESYYVLGAQSCPALCDPMDCSCQAPLSMAFLRQEYWSGLPFSLPGGLPDPAIKPPSPALAGGFFITTPPGNPIIDLQYYISFMLT